MLMKGLDVWNDVGLNISRSLIRYPRRHSIRPAFDVVARKVVVVDVQVGPSPTGSDMEIVARGRTSRHMLRFWSRVEQPCQKVSMDILSRV